MANAFRECGRPHEAIAAYRRALELQGDFALAHGNLGNILADIGEFEPAITAYRRALSIEPDSANTHHGLAIVLTYRGQSDDALVHFRKAMQLEPGLVHFHSDFLIALHYHPQVTLSGLFEAHCEFDRLHAAGWRDSWTPHHHSPDPDRALRVGFVLPHFARHPVGRFLIRPLENLDPDEFHCFCYSDTRRLPLL